MTEKLIDEHIGVLSESERKAWIWGFHHCMYLFAIWKNGEQFIGCRETNVKEIRTQMKRELDALDP